jgi:hypothetical protein
MIRTQRITAAPQSEVAISDATFETSQALRAKDLRGLDSNLRGYRIPGRVRPLVELTCRPLRCKLRACKEGRSCRGTPLTRFFLTVLRFQLLDAHQTRPISPTLPPLSSMTGPAIAAAALPADRVMQRGLAWISLPAVYRCRISSLRPVSVLDEGKAHSGMTTFANSGRMPPRDRMTDSDLVTSKHPPPPRGRFPG